jgi:hypothetical protein
MALVQEQQFLITCSVDDVVLGTFDSFEGGDVTSDAKTYRAGGMADAEALPAPPSTEDVTIARGFRAERDAAKKKWLNGKIGAKIVIGKQALNPDKTPVADALETFTGIVKSVAGPSHDSTGEDVSKLTIVATISGLPT